jgi:hypothetical protein
LLHSDVLKLVWLTMPAEQRGSVLMRNGRWAVRYRDADGRQRYASGFEKPIEARRWLRAKVDEVAAQRRGDPAALIRKDAPTLGELTLEFLAGYVAEPNSRRTLKARLRLVGPGRGVVVAGAHFAEPGPA